VVLGATVCDPFECVVNAPFVLCAVVIGGLPLTSPIVLLRSSLPVLIFVSIPILDPSDSDGIIGEDAVMKDGYTTWARAPPVTTGSFTLLEEGVP
jgi:hypothetical protein